MEGGYHGCGVKGLPILDGGLGSEKPANPEIQALCDLVKAEFQIKSGVNAAKFKAVSYRTQVVAGTNYFVKVDLGGGQFCHVRIYRPLLHTGEEASLHGFQLGKKKEEPINYF